MSVGLISSTRGSLVNLLLPSTPLEVDQSYKMLQRGFAVVRTQSLRSQERQFITCRCLSQKKKKARPMRVAEKLGNCSFFKFNVNDILVSESYDFIAYM